MQLGDVAVECGRLQSNLVTGFGAPGIEKGVGPARGQRLGPPALGVIVVSERMSPDRSSDAWNSTPAPDAM